MIKEKLGIKYNPNSDSGSIDHNFTIDEIQDACETHNKNVSSVLYVLSEAMHKRGDKHDWSIIQTLDDYIHAYSFSLKGEIPFEESEYFLNHAISENHHLNKFCDENVNLFDIIEFLVDQCVLHKEKAEETPQPYLMQEILLKAFNNTAKQIDDNLVVTL